MNFNPLSIDVSPLLVDVDEPLAVEAGEGFLISDETEMDGECPPGPANPEIAQIRYSELQISSFLGGGKFGKVHKAHHPHFGVVAIKYSEDVEEIKKLNMFSDHPNIIRVLGFVTEPSPGFVMEFMDCGSLDELLLARPTVQYLIDHALSWLRQAASGAAIMHAKNYVHRDLKPLNLLLSHGYRILKLCDFGTVAKLRLEMTIRQGSAPWMAPEVFQSKEYTSACDVYSMGIVMWQLFSRKKPYPNATTINHILWAVCYGNRPPALNGHPIFMKMIQRCWSGDPNRRPTMRQLELYSEALLKIYTNWNSPIADVSRLQSMSPAPRTFWSSAARSSESSAGGTLTHRRAGSHETALIKHQEQPENVTCSRAARSHSFVGSPLDVLRRRLHSKHEAKTQIEIPQHLVPELPIRGNVASEERFNEHVANVYAFQDFSKRERELLREKHALIFQVRKAHHLHKQKKHLEYLDNMVVESTKKMTLKLHGE